MPNISKALAISGVALLAVGAAFDGSVWADKAQLTFALGAETAVSLILSSLLWYRSAWSASEADCNATAAGYSGIAAALGATALFVQLAPDGPVPTWAHVGVCVFYSLASVIAVALVLGDPGRRPSATPAPPRETRGYDGLTATVVTAVVAGAWLARLLRKED